MRACISTYFFVFYRLIKMAWCLRQLIVLESPSEEISRPNLILSNMYQNLIQ